jgi:hypothetical protein
MWRGAPTICSSVRRCWVASSALQCGGRSLVGGRSALLGGRERREGAKPSLRLLADPRRFYSSVGTNSMDQRKRVLVIYTGGTMGMLRNSQRSLEPCPGFLTEKLMKMEELQSETMPEVEVME